MLSPQHFTPQFESHYWPSPALKQHTFGASKQDRPSRKNLFVNKEEQVNNLMKVNIIFRNLICHLYEFYICQRYLSNRIVDVLKQLCIENGMIDDLPTDSTLVEGFMEIFVLPLFKPIYANNSHAPIPCELSDDTVKKELDIQVYPLHIKTDIESLRYRMAILLLIACKELQLDDEETVFAHLDEWKSVKHHTLKLSILAYKSWLNSLCLTHYRHHAVCGYLRELYAEIQCKHEECVNNIDIDMEVVGVTLNNFYCPFGSNKTVDEINDIIYGTFQDACGEKIALLVQSIMNTVMATHMFLSTHCAEISDAESI